MKNSVKALNQNSGGFGIYDRSFHGSAMQRKKKGSMMMAVFCVVAPCDLVEVYQCFSDPG
jgi:hypothetical protein